MDVGIYIHTGKRGQSRYSDNGDIEQTWDLADAERIGLELLRERNATYVTLIGDEREFQMWGEEQRDTERWAPWYVDVELAGHRWMFQPGQQLDDYSEASDVADEATEIEGVTKVWVGKSDGGSEEVTEVRDH